MPTITLTDNTSLTIDASSSDDNATLNRYLSRPLKFVTAGGFGAIGNTRVNALTPAAFPLSAAASGAGQFTVRKSSLGVQAGATASISLLEGGSKTAFFAALELPDHAAVNALLAFSIGGTISAGPSVPLGDFCLGVMAGSSLTLSSFYQASGEETFADAIKRAAAGITIPRDLEDLKSLPSHCICQVDASGTLQYSASLSYSFLSQPLATLSTLEKLPPIVINASAAATVEATVTHISDHTVVFAKQENGMLRLSVSLTKTSDFETSLTVSAGLSAGAGGFDAIAFLLGKISPNGLAETQKLREDIPPQQAAALSAQIKGALNSALSSSLQVSLQAALDKSKSTNRLFLFDIDLNGLDETASKALLSALAGDFRDLTIPGQKLKGITLVDSVLSDTTAVTHNLVIHLLGIFNWQDTNTFMKQVTVGVTNDTHELVLSDERIKVVTDSLKAEKLREVVLRGVTLTLPLTANTPEAAVPLSSVYFERQGAANPAQMRQFVNELKRAASPTASRAATLLEQNLDKYGPCSLYLGLDLTPKQCKQIFLNAGGTAYDWTYYLSHACTAAAAILSGSQDQDGVRLRLFTAGIDVWKKLKSDGATDVQSRSLVDYGIAPGLTQAKLLYTDIVTFIWWSDAMEKYSHALANGLSLAKAGQGVVNTTAKGFEMPWLILALADMLQPRPVITSFFTSALIPPAVGAGAQTR